MGDEALKNLLERYCKILKNISDGKDCRNEMSKVRNSIIDYLNINDKDDIKKVDMVLQNFPGEMYRFNKIYDIKEAIRLIKLFTK